MTSNLPTPLDYKWEQRVVDLEATVLTDLRGSAEKWRTALGSLTGVVAGAAAVGAPFIGSNLTDGGTKVALGVTIAAAIVALLIGTVASMRASIGVPAAIKNSGSALRKWTYAEWKIIGQCLQVAHWATGIGLAALCVAFAIGFFGSSNPTQNARITTPAGEFCGVFSADGSTVMVTGMDGTVHAVKFAQITALKIVDGC